MKTLGIDLGSRYVKFAGYDTGLLFTFKVDTVEFYRRCGVPTGGVDIRRLDLFEGSKFDFDHVATTGYGRYNVSIEGAETISEIRAHAQGAISQTGLSDFTLIDLGGQDTKVIRVCGGRVEDFAMNNKCAAGSGRYLENIAGMLGITPEEFGEHREGPVKLSVTCAIFGESEVIGRLSEGVKIENICAGANLSVARRVVSLMRRYPSNNYIVTGGVACNGAVVGFLSERCGGKLMVPEHPIFNGAIGSALIASVSLPASADKNFSQTPKMVG